MSEIQLPERAQQILNGSMPEKMRSGIAAGAVPMPPQELVSCLAVMAVRDANEELRSKAATTLKELPESVRKTAIQSPLAAPVFRVLVKMAALSRDEREALILNNDAPDDVIATLARSESDARVLEILSNNQARMLRHVELVEALLENVSIGPAARAKLEEFFGRAYAGKILLQKGLATKEELVGEEEWDSSLVDAIADSAEAAGDEDDSDLNDFVAGADDEFADEEEAAQMIAAAAGEEGASADEKITNLRKAIKDMPVAKKIKLALMGNKEARSLLVLDGNKVVSSMVLRNARITDKEVLAIASSKSIREDMLRQIARTKKFMKLYSVKYALVSNAKTPQSISMQLLPQMRDSDLKVLSKSKGVPNTIATQARRMVQKKAQKQ